MRLTASSNALLATVVILLFSACGTSSSGGGGGIGTAAQDTSDAPMFNGGDAASGASDTVSGDIGSSQTGGDAATGQADAGADAGAGAPDAGPGEYTKLCDPCLSSTDCKQVGHETACLDAGKDGLFCGRRCNADKPCDAGYDCLISTTAEGISAKYCVAVDANKKRTDCRCSPAATQAKLSTPCWKDKVDAAGTNVGKCPGKRTCNGPVLGVCQMNDPDEEICDGIDNDCDGFVDPSNAPLCPNKGKCEDGKCVDDCKPVDGGWSAWVAGSCSKTCGGGELKSTRICNNPAPSCGGKACAGDATKTESCNTQACGGSGSDLPAGKTVYKTGEQVIKGTVPAGKTNISFHLWGAGGGGGAPGIGGGGAFVQTMVAVKAGDQVELRVGGGGVAGGGGGGATYVFINGKVVTVAAGGGGAGWDGCTGCTGGNVGTGGGGGKVGGNGQDGTANNKYNTGSGQGFGGTPTAGGKAGKSNNQSQYKTCTLDGLAGAAHTGGAGAVGKCTHKSEGASWHIGGKTKGSNGTGGDGGAGWFGGGSGATMWTYSGGGGGGGSSHVAAPAVLVASEAGSAGTAGGSSSSEFAAGAGQGGTGQVKGGSTASAGGAGRIVMSL